MMELTLLDAGYSFTDIQNMPLRRAIHICKAFRKYTNFKSIENITNMIFANNRSVEQSTYEEHMNELRFK